MFSSKPVAVKPSKQPDAAKQPQPTASQKSTSKQPQQPSKSLFSDSDDYEDDMFSTTSKPQTEAASQKSTAVTAAPLAGSSGGKGLFSDSDEGDDLFSAASKAAPMESKVDEKASKSSSAKASEPTASPTSQHKGTRLYTL